MRCIKLLVEYAGTAYQGWQSQRSGQTVQDILRGKISSITGENVRLAGASRTDSGVHALGQVAVFSTFSGLAADTFMKALNAKLPADIRIMGSEDVDCEFSPRYRALRKSYFYLLSMRREQSAFLHKYVWHVKRGLNVADMIRSAAIIKGEHDFSAFRGSGCGAKTTVRKIYSIEISLCSEIGFMTASIKGDFLKIRIEANAFLRHMVRNIVGTLVEVGRGRLTPDMVKEILVSRDRKLAGPTAPAKGLFLEEIIY